MVYAEPSNRVPEYVEKDEPGFRRIGMTAETFAQAYSVPIRVRPNRVAGALEGGAGRSRPPSRYGIAKV